MATKTLTVLFTDMANYTAAVSSSDRSRLRQLIGEHEEKVAMVLEEAGGTVVKNIGDSFMTLFSSATDAIKAGVNLLESLSEELSFNVRIAIATGDVEEISNDYFGDCVNLASRILSKTPVNEIWFAQSTFLSMNQSEQAWEEVGDFFFKGFFRNVQVYRIVLRDQVHLPEALEKALLENRLVLLRNGETISSMPQDPEILLLDFPPSGQELDQVLGIFSHVAPQSLWLCGYKISPKQRWEWIQKGSHWVIAEHKFLEGYVQARLEEQEQHSSAMTLIVDRKSLFKKLKMHGIALPRLPISDVVVGYQYYLNHSGRWTPKSTNPLFCLQVSINSISLQSLSGNIYVGDVQVAIGQILPLTTATMIRAGDFKLHFRPLGHGAFMGLVLGEEESATPLTPGTKIDLGREQRDFGINLRDHRAQNNIVWASTPQAQKAKESGFTMERALMGRKQARLYCEKDSFFIEQLHNHCQSYILESGVFVELTGKKTLEVDQLIILGTNVLSIQHASVS
ncbi:MAG: adenylate/guanylate cyclase domain-containing protein [Myxococcota bacterium]|nr:adenylate/guanylate cyclase domain-containing protein [Myxococcota bacterium]